MARYNEHDDYIGIRNSIEAFGFSTELGHEKMYLLGLLPIADVFIAWSNSIESLEFSSKKTNKNWRIAFQILSLTTLIICVLLILLVKKRQNIMS